MDPRERAADVISKFGYPERMPRRGIAEVLKRHAYEVDPRSLERWPLASRLINKKAYIETVDALALAFERLDATPLVMSGRRTSRTAEQTAA